MFKKLGSKLKEQKGFTLIELLAVIVILGIIAAIAIPSITNVMDKSKNKAKVTEAIQIIEAAKLAYSENNAKVKFHHAAATTDTADLTTYVSKVKDTTYIVTFNTLTNVWSIDHEAADIAEKTSTKDGVVSEDELATAAR